MAIKKENKKFKKGISTIEILVVVAVVAVVFTSLLGLITFSLRIVRSNKQTVLAEKLVQETIEATRNFRDQTDWDTEGLGVLTTGIAYYPQKTTGTPPVWDLIQGEENIEEFTRKIVFEKVYRDTNDNISQSGTEDPETLKVKATVSWFSSLTQENQKVEIITYLTNWRQ